MTATSPAPASDTTAPAWGTWKRHGNLSAITYYGKSLKAPADEGINLVVSVGPDGLQGLTQDGKLVLTGGVATRFWATPDMTAPANQPDEAEAKVAQAIKDEAATVEPKGTVKDIKAKVGKDGKLATAKVPHACKCGCGRTCLGTYAQGHDARHVAQLRQAVIDGRMTEDGALTNLIHAPKLQAKLRHSLDLHAQAERKRDQAAKDKAAQPRSAKAAQPKPNKSAAKMTKQAEDAKAAQTDAKAA